MGKNKWIQIDASLKDLWDRRPTTQELQPDLILVLSPQNFYLIIYSQVLARDMFQTMYFLMPFPYLSFLFSSLSLPTILLPPLP